MSAVERVSRISVGTVAVTFLFLLGLPAASLALDNGQCFDCHGDSGILTWSKEELASNVKPGGAPKTRQNLGLFPDISLSVDKEKYTASVHKDLTCTDCHADIADLPHRASLKAVDCSGCHSEVAATWMKSRHVVGTDKKRLAEPVGCSDCHGAHAIMKSSLSTSPVNRRHASETCERCHSHPEIVAKAGIPGAGAMYENSVHNRAIVEKGLMSSATCPDCHGAHNVTDRMNPASPVFRTNIPSTCGKCHFGVLTIYKESIHGTALARGVPDAPACTDCHGEHEIRAAADPKSPVSAAAISQKTCPSCHAAEKLAQRYGIAVEKVQGYKDSFHGLSMGLGDVKAANCASCHGTHEIYPSSDPRSTVNVKNLPVTCGKCHPGATENFAKGNIHVGAGGLGGTIKYYVQNIYIWLIVLTIGGMAAHNGLDFFRKMQILYRKRREEFEASGNGYERLNSSERWQHVFTFTTFITLVISGFALKFKWSLPFVSDQANVALRSGSHRVAAILMVATCLYHLAYVILTPRGRRQFLQMLPTLKDAQDIVDMMKFYFGLTDHRPRCARFTYVEKAEYLALVWGSIVMIVTGFLLWFQDAALKHMPMWGLDVATIVHYYEAILATLAIIVWHFYYVFINPDFAPMAFTWIDGKLTRHQMEHEHPLELEEIEQAERSGESPVKGSKGLLTEET